MALQLQEAGQRGHGRAADAAEMNVRGTLTCHCCVTAGSSRLQLRFVAATVNSASTPKVSVTFWRETWPLRRPMAMGPSKSSKALQNHLFEQLGRRAGRGAIEHFAEDDAAHALELAGLRAVATTCGRSGRAWRQCLQERAACLRSAAPRACPAAKPECSGSRHRACRLRACRASKRAGLRRRPRCRARRPARR